MGSTKSQGSRPGPANVSAQFYRPWSQYTAIRLAIEWRVEDKLLFGSDFPVPTPQETIDGLLAANTLAERAGLPPIGEDALHRIIHRDSLALLGIGMTAAAAVGR